MKKHMFNSAITASVSIIILLVLSYALPCLRAQAAESDPVCWGVFVGVSEYSTSPNVVYADDDARALYEIFSPVWGTSHTRVLIDSVATEAAILDAISWMSANANANDTVTFTFSGLGVTPGAIGPSDFTPVNGGLTATQLADAFASVRAQKILIILDCDYAGKFRVSLSKEGRVLMLSSTVQEKSEESPEFQHGVFTYFILQALNNFDAYDTNQNHELSVEEIAPYANEMTANVVNIQHPILDDRVNGELPLLTSFSFVLSTNLPSGVTVVTLDDVDYTSAPVARLWVPGSTHTMTVPDVVNVDSGTRYTFSSWRDGNTSVDRTIFKGPYTANFRLEYLLTVTSPYGETTGTGWYITGANANFSVTSSVETAYIRRFFTGWSGDFTGTSPAGSLMMNAPKTVTADWRTEYLLTLDSEYSSPSGAGWYDEGESVNISIESVSGFPVRQIFDGWTGDFSSTEASTVITMDSPKAIVATWHTDYFWVYILVAIVVVLVAVVIYILIRLRVFRRLVTPSNRPRHVKIYPPSPPQSRSKR
jgi:hypothetical protein